MTICLAKVAATGRLDAGSAGEEFLAWYRSGPADVGVQTQAVLSGAATAAGLPSRAAAYYQAHPDRSAGNGSLMRTAPVALAYLGDDRAIAEAAREISGVTHADPLAGDACVLWCIAIDRAVREARLDGITEGLELLPAERRPAWAEHVRRALADPPGSFAPNGFVVTALQAALAAVSQTPVPGELPPLHFQRALEAAVAIGDDTDTVAAIAGSLLGARWGISAIPYAWRRMLHGWPACRARDLVRLAVLTVRDGQPDGSGWPVAERIVPHYVKKFSLRPYSASLRAAPGVLVGNAAALPGIRAGAIVSLCRVGAADPPAGTEVDEVWLVDSADPADNPNLEFVLADLADAIARFREEGKTVFVHCVAGESRTPAAAAGYLVRRLGMAPEAAFAQVKTALPISHPKDPLRAAVERLGAGGAASARRER